MRGPDEPPSRIAIALAVLLMLSAVAFTISVSVVVAQEAPYQNESNDTGRSNWTDNHTEVDLVNVSHYVARVGAFVVGDDPTDPGVGPLFVGLMVGVMAITVLGQSKAGLVGGGAMGIFTIAALSAPLGTGLMPRWMYGTVVLLIAFIAGITYIRVMR